MERAILHSDLNCFFASVECVLDPSLRGRPVAVCGSTEERHGIVLAKTEEAKRAGIKTGMVTWQAKQLCPSLYVVSEPNFSYYLKFSDLVKKIYRRYTDRVEPFGIDECWLDITGLRRPPEEVADEIRNTVREELGLTVSIGVSFNKVFAKLGSDMKKPDAITVISKENYKEKVWRLDVGDLIFCGRATAKKLNDRNVRTVGDLAALPPEYPKSWLGVNGVALWRFANGLDDSPVMLCDMSPLVKSVGHGSTFTEDLKSNEEIRRAMLELSQDIGCRLRKYRLASGAVTVTARDDRLNIMPLGIIHGYPTQSPSELALRGYSLFLSRYKWTSNVRTVTLRAVELIPQELSVCQLDAFTDGAAISRREAVDDTVYGIRGRFGKRAILPASLLGELKMAESDTRDELRNFGASIALS